MAAQISLHRGLTKSSRAQDSVFAAPRFVEPLENDQEVIEGEPVSFSSNVVPVDDPTLRVEWFRNNQPINAGSRVHATFERGCAMLDIMEALPEDAGEYYCQVTSGHGADKTAPVQLKVTATAAVIHDSYTLPSNAASVNSGSNRPVTRNDLDPSRGHPPSILQVLEPAQIIIHENEPVHLESKVEPFTDPYLTVDWFKNGSPFSVGSRFSAIYDRGHVSLDILYAYPEDSGTYYFIAKNNNGQSQSNKVEVKCIPEDSVITKSSLSQELIAFLDSFDAPGDVNAKYDDFRYREFQEPVEAPVVDIPLESQTAPENGPAKFLVKISGYPRPRLLWFVNDNLITSTSSYRIYHDGSINYLEFYRCKEVGTTKVRVVARNKVGETSSEAELIVVASEDYRPELRHVRPENAFKRLMALRKVETTPELESALRKPKAHVTQMRKVERDSELRAKANKPEVLEAENLYMSVQSHLRRSDSTSGAAAELMQAKQKQQYEKKLQMEYVQKLQENQQNASLNLSETMENVDPSTPLA